MTDLKRRSLFTIEIVYLFAAILFVIVLFPFYWIFVRRLKKRSRCMNCRRVLFLDRSI